MLLPTIPPARCSTLLPLLCASLSDRSFRHSIAPRCSSTSAEAPCVYLTRESGKNDKLQSLLEARGVPSHELPCIAFESMPGAAELPARLASGGFEWVVITSPEAASVFLEAWDAGGRPTLRAASVGAGTSKVLAAGGLPPEFEPSKATAEVLAAELPVQAPQPVVLFPCSALARGTLAKGLAVRHSQSRVDLGHPLPGLAPTRTGISP